jgi:hypothetical protein
MSEEGGTLELPDYAVIAGKPFFMKLQTRDAYGNPVEEGGAVAEASIQLEGMIRTGNDINGKSFEFVQKILSK